MNELARGKMRARADVTIGAIREAHRTVPGGDRRDGAMNPARPHEPAAGDLQLPARGPPTAGGAPNAAALRRVPLMENSRAGDFRIGASKVNRRDGLIRHPTGLTTETDRRVRRVK